MSGAKGKAEEHKGPSPATITTYGVHWHSFMRWCRRTRIKWPAIHEEVARYLTSEIALLTPGSAGVHVAAIGYHYRLAGLPFDPKHDAIKEAVLICKQARAYQRQQQAEQAAKQGELM